jgi:hypothetical protein
MLRFDPPTLKQELSKALELISKKTSGLYTAADFGDMIDVNDPDFDPELLDDAVITPDTIVRFDPPGAATSFNISYREVIALLCEARQAEIDSQWRFCRSPSAAFVPVVPRTADSHELANKLADRHTTVEIEDQHGVLTIQLVSGLTVFGVCAALEGNYSDDFLHSVSEERFFIQISRPHLVSVGSSSEFEMILSAEEVQAYAAAFLYELNVALDMQLEEFSFRFNEDYPDEDAVTKKLETFAFPTTPDRTRNGRNSPPLQ